MAPGLAGTAGLVVVVDIGPCLLDMTAGTGSRSQLVGGDNVGWVGWDDVVAAWAMAHQHDDNPVVDAMIAENCCGKLRRMVDVFEATAHQHVGSPVVDALVVGTGWLVDVEDVE